MSNGPIVTVEQGLEIQAWVKQRERELRGQIKLLQHNMRAVQQSRDLWREACLEEHMNANCWREAHEEATKLRCRKRLQWIVRLLLDL